MTKFRLLLATLTLATLPSLAHADFAEGAHQFKTDVKTAGKETGHAIGNAGHAARGPQAMRSRGPRAMAITRPSGG
jgi:hypothetical protein